MDQQKIRKQANKPQTERRRRERINKSLEQMKNLVLKGTNKEGTMKLEKADIMDMTVRYVEELQQRKILEDQAKSLMILNSYIQGYSSCINDVITAASSARMLSDDLQYKLSSHLSTRLYTLTTGHQQHDLLPAHSPTYSTSCYRDSREESRTTSTPSHSFITDISSPAQISPICGELPCAISPSFSASHFHHSAYSPNSTASVDSGVSCSSVWRPW